MAKIVTAEMKKSKQVSYDEMTLMDLLMTRYAAGQPSPMTLTKVVKGADQVP